MNKSKGIKGLIIGIILLCLVLGYYYYLSNRKSDKEATENVKLTAVQEVLLRDLDNNYPPTPREVVKYFGEIAQCVYSGDCTEEESLQLSEQARRLYDEELLNNNTGQQYIDNFSWDMNNFKEQGIVISSFSPASSIDVEHFSQDGYSWAQMRCTFSLRKGTQLSTTKEVFMLRKDEAGHWKIYGWALADDGNGEIDGQ